MQPIQLYFDFGTFAVADDTSDPFNFQKRLEEAQKLQNQIKEKDLERQIKQEEAEKRKAVSHKPSEINRFQFFKFLSFLRLEIFSSNQLEDCTSSSSGVRS